jgi:hypothetical protein
MIRSLVSDVMQPKCFVSKKEPKENIQQRWCPPNADIRKFNVDGVLREG